MSKVVLITGGSRGIGRAAALLCAARGWSIGVNYATNRSAARRNCSPAWKPLAAAAIAIQADVCEEADVIALFDATVRAFGPLDGFVNNAGFVAPGSALADMDVERMKRVFDTNVLGAYLCAREAARRMSTKRGGRGGSIVNVSSAAARLGSPNEYVDYAGSKGAVDNLTIGLAKNSARKACA